MDEAESILAKLIKANAVKCNDDTNLLYVDVFDTGPREPGPIELTEEEADLVRELQKPRDDAATAKSILFKLLNEGLIHRRLPKYKQDELYDCRQEGYISLTREEMDIIGELEPAWTKIVGKE